MFSGTLNPEYIFNCGAVLGHPTSDVIKSLFEPPLQFGTLPNVIEMSNINHNTGNSDMIKCQRFFLSLEFVGLNW